MKYDITALGDILIDFSPMGEDEAGDPVFVRKAGGAPLNLLATVAKFGGKAAFIGKVGEDMFGRYLAQVLRDNGIGFYCYKFDLIFYRPHYDRATWYCADGERRRGEKM